MDSEKAPKHTGQPKLSIKERINALKQKAKQLKKNVYLLYLAYKHPKTPWYAKVLTALVVAYALSPIDLVPDFIPILGYLDDLIIIPAGITLAIKLIPKEVMDECRNQQDNNEDIRKKGTYAAVAIILFWLLIIFLIIKRIILK